LELGRAKLLLMPRAHPQPALQDYLKAIYQVTESRGGEPANTKAIATRLGVSQPSVSAMLDRMAADGQVDYVHYAGASLTRKGRRAALRVIRRHRLLELYLERFLGLGWDEVHEEAELLEHALSARVEAAIDEALGHPTFDPHGDPIPGPDGSLVRPAWQSLWDSDVTGRVRVARVSDGDPALLRHLQRLGIVPGATLSSVRRESGGALRLHVGRREELLGREAAERVYVTRV
jgi:DtxR family Mn-dependent transcriptional regulator